LPDASRQNDGEKKSCPSSFRRTITQRERRSPFGTIAQVPERHPNVLPDPSHEPSTQTAPERGFGGMNSTGAGLGEVVTS